MKRKRSAPHKSSSEKPVPTFTDQDRRDLARLKEQLSIGLERERRMGVVIVENARYMVEVKVRELFHLDKSRDFEAWVYKHYKIKRKQAHKYLRIGQELTVDGVAGRRLCFNGAYQVALAPKALRETLLKLSDDGSSAGAMATARLKATPLLPAEGDPEYEERLKQALEAARRAAGGRDKAEGEEPEEPEVEDQKDVDEKIRLAEGHAGRLSKALTGALDEEEVPERSLEDLEDRMRASLVAYLLLQARSQGQEVRPEDVEAQVQQCLRLPSPSGRGAGGEGMAGTDSIKPPVQDPPTTPPDPPPITSPQQEDLADDPLVNPRDRELPEAVRTAPCRFCEGTLAPELGLVRHEEGCVLIPSRLQCHRCRGQAGRTALHHEESCSFRVPPLYDGHAHDWACRLDPQCPCYQGSPDGYMVNFLPDGTVRLAGTVGDYPLGTVMSSRPDSS